MDIGETARFQGAGGARHAVDKKNETPKAWHSSSPLYTQFFHDYQRN